MSVSEYLVVDSDNIELLEEQVTKLLKKGYTPIGGCCAVSADFDGSDGVAIFYYQTMVKSN